MLSYEDNVAPQQQYARSKEPLCQSFARRVAARSMGFILSFVLIAMLATIIAVEVSIGRGIQGAAFAILSVVLTISLILNTRLPRTQPNYITGFMGIIISICAMVSCGAFLAGWVAKNVDPYPMGIAFFVTLFMSILSILWTIVNLTPPSSYDGEYNTSRVQQQQDLAVLNYTGTAIIGDEVAVQSVKDPNRFPCLTGFFNTLVVLLWIAFALLMILFTNESVNSIVELYKFSPSPNKLVWVGERNSTETTPTTFQPTTISTITTFKPTLTPSKNPTRTPSSGPITFQPSQNPTNSPSETPSYAPSKKPSKTPTLAPSKRPSLNPTNQPTTTPSRSPSNHPTSNPSKLPTLSPSQLPSKLPSEAPTSTPSLLPTTSPTNPTPSPTDLPTGKPTDVPTTSAPSTSPSSHPSSLPTSSPSKKPTETPTTKPSESPSNFPTAAPTLNPSRKPTPSPTPFPTLSPTQLPTNAYTTTPSTNPTSSPTSNVTTEVTIAPTTALTTNTTTADDINVPHVVQVNCEGPVNATPPYVLFESDIGGTYLDWTWIQRNLTANGIRSCSYTRSGLGFSQTGIQPRTAESMALELADIYSHLNLGYDPKSLIIVSQGFGSFVSRVFHSVHIPDVVKGFVFVDAIHQNEMNQCNKDATPIYDGYLSTSAFSCSIGWNRFQSTVIGADLYFQNPHVDELPDDVYDEVNALLSRCQWYDTVYLEDGFKEISCGQASNLPNANRVNADIVQIMSQFVEVDGAQIPRNSTYHQQISNWTTANGKAITIPSTTDKNIVMNQVSAMSIAQEILDMMF